MEIHHITFEEYEKNLWKFRTKAQEQKIKYMVKKGNKEIFEVTPVFHEDEPDEVDTALWEIKN